MNMGNESKRKLEKVESQENNQSWMYNVDPEMCEQNGTFEELNKKIQVFLQERRKRSDEQNIREFCNRDPNDSNDYSCARVDAVFQRWKDFKCHFKVTTVTNQHGPQTMDMEKLYKLDSYSAARLRNVVDKGLTEIIKPVPVHVYQRLKKIECRISFLHNINPLYKPFMENYKQDNNEGRNTFVGTADSAIQVGDLQNNLATEENNCEIESDNRYKIDHELLLIKASAEEINRRIQAFLAYQGQLKNEEKVENMDERDANEDEKYSRTKNNGVFEHFLSSALEERLSDAEASLGIRSREAVNVYHRLQKIEDRILFFEGTSPEYTANNSGMKKNPRERKRSYDSRGFEKENLTKFYKFSRTSSCRFQNFVDEGLTDIFKPVPRDVYERLKNIENQILYIRGTPSEYEPFMLINFDQGKSSTRQTVSSETNTNSCNFLTPALEERLSDAEASLGIKKSVTESVYARLKNMEDRIFFLEATTPEYFRQTTQLTTMKI